MKIKMFVKSIVGFIRCFINGIRWPSNGSVYLGSHIHVENGKKLNIESGVQIRPYVDIFVHEEMHIGKGTDIGVRNRICGTVKIGNNVLIGPDNYISSVDHIYENIEKPIMAQGARNLYKNGHTVLCIGDDSWIGTHCAIIGCVNIGKHCIIANSVVINDVPDYSVVAGVPARVIKKYDVQEQKWL